jgi:hypothetical protein
MHAFWRMKALGMKHFTTMITMWVPQMIKQQAGPWGRVPPSYSWLLLYAYTRRCWYRYMSQIFANYQQHCSAAASMSDGTAHPPQPTTFPSSERYIQHPAIPAKQHAARVSAVGSHRFC